MNQLSLLLQGKQMTIYVANVKSKHQVKIKILDFPVLKEFYDEVSSNVNIIFDII